MSWSDLQVVYSNTSWPDFKVVIGNAAPVQDRDSGRILLPFCRNNLQVLFSYSDDDGVTWAPPVNLTSATFPVRRHVNRVCCCHLSSDRLLIANVCCCHIAELDMG